MQKPIFIVALLAVAACGGPAVTPEDTCAPATDRSECHEGRPRICGSSGRWHETAPEGCPPATVCCLIHEDERDVHGCAPQDRCLPEEMQQVADPLLEPDDAGADAAAMEEGTEPPPPREEG